MDKDGNAYVTGRTESRNFPTTAVAFDKKFNGNSDAFIFKLNASGVIDYSTFVGGGGR